MLKAFDIMSQDVAIVRGSATVAEAIKLMRLKEVRTLIVDIRSTDDAYGIVTQTDIVYKVVAYGKDPAAMRVYEIMTKPCISVNPDLGVEYVARLFANTGIHVAPVIREGILGIISLSDILNKGDFLEKPKVVVARNELSRAIAEAKSLCAGVGITSKECAAAWALVEDIEAEMIYQSGMDVPEKTAFQLYCDENPKIFQVLGTGQLVTNRVAR
ncbi:CBS domain-containing protein [Pseudanabaena yagii]|uniref:CBS domain-containing protein n=1 Tax=Pseudanabaena yagii GIHE-NHR1 TaxID=2722753 RepID=A0ABX1LVS2_9CYAN|nr:CBS domain-containing protein [Pseudanabaena yagii]NMF60244.1 CBS domain-containing protein [Pseudanabaena yagii GIHE-NHR1]